MSEVKSTISSELREDLDATRAVSSYVILLAHASQWFVAPLLGVGSMPVKVMGYMARYAVMTFLMISGYLITRSLHTSMHQEGGLDEVRFLQSRAIRILPPFLFAFAISLAVALIINGFGLHGSVSFRLPGDLYVARESIALDTGDVLATLFLSNGIVRNTAAIVTNGPLWYLSVQVWIYLLALLVAVAWQHRLRDRAGRIALVALVSLCVLLSPLRAEFWQYVLYWGLGGCLWVCAFLRRKSLFLLLVVLCILPQSVVGALMLAQGTPGAWGWMTVPTMLVLLMAGVLLFMAVRKLMPRPWIRLLSGFGKSSYTLYLIHFPLLALLFSLFHRRYMEWDTMARSWFLVTITILILMLARLLARFLENRRLCENFLAHAISRLSKKARARPPIA